MHREVPSQRSIYTQKSSLHKGDLHTESLNTDTFTHRKFYTQKRLRRTETFTQSSFYTQKLLHKKDFIQRSFYTQELLHKETFTQDSFYTHKLFTPRSLTHRSLRTDAFTQRSLYTEGTNLESETSRGSATKNQKLKSANQMRALFSRFVVHQTVSTLWFLAWCVFWEIVAGGFSAMFAIFNLSLFHPLSLKPFGMEEPMPRMKWKNQDHFINGLIWKIEPKKNLKFWCHVGPSIL